MRKIPLARGHWSRPPRGVHGLGAIATIATVATQKRGLLMGPLLLRFGLVIYG